MAGKKLIATTTGVPAWFHTNFMSATLDAAAAHGKDPVPVASPTLTDGVAERERDVEMGQTVGSLLECANTSDSLTTQPPSEPATATVDGKKTKKEEKDENEDQNKLLLFGALVFIFLLLLFNVFKPAPGIDKPTEPKPAADNKQDLVEQEASLKTVDAAFQDFDLDGGEVSNGGGSGTFGNDIIEGKLDFGPREANMIRHAQQAQTSSVFGSLLSLINQYKAALGPMMMTMGPFLVKMMGGLGALGWINVAMVAVSLACLYLVTDRWPRYPRSEKLSDRAVFWINRMLIVLACLGMTGVAMMGVGRMFPAHVWTGAEQVLIQFFSLLPEAMRVWLRSFGLTM